MSTHPVTAPTTPTAAVPVFAPGKRIIALLPDDGTDRRLISALRQDKGVNRVDSVTVRAVAMLQEVKTRKGRLPESEMARLVTVIADAADADDLFDFIFQFADIGRPGGGMLLMDRLPGVLPFTLPANVQDETG